MLQIGICDDNSNMPDYLAHLCIQVLPECGVRTYKNGLELLNGPQVPDILLMDVEMEGISGLDTVKQLHGQSVQTAPQRPAVIFITAHSGYVFEALDLFAFHYLIKPVDEKKFEKVLRQAAAECLAFEKEEALLFHTKSSHLRLYPSQIYYVESSLRKVIIHTEKDQFELYATMSEMEELLGKNFYRCHRGYLVNLNKIAQYDRQLIRLADGTDILLSKPKYGEFLDTFMHFLKRTD